MEVTRRRRRLVSRSRCRTDVGIGHNVPVNDFLVTCLDSIDKRLLDYLDEDEELPLDTVRRLQCYASALLDGSLVPTAVVEDWEDFYDLAGGFVTAYGSEVLMDLFEEAPFLAALGRGEAVALTEVDRHYLRKLVQELDMYPELGALRPRPR